MDKNRLEQKSPRYSSREIRALVVLVGLLLAAALLVDKAGSITGSVLILGLAIGYVLQRSRFCIASAYMDLWLFQSGALFRGVLIFIAVSAVGFFLLQYRGDVGFVSETGWQTALGGVIFGCGMLLAGGCASGTLLRLGEGYVLFVAVFVGLIGGSVLGARHIPFWDRLPDLHRAVFLPSIIGWWPAFLATLALLGLVGWLVRDGNDG